MHKNMLDMFYDDLGEIDFRRFFDSENFSGTGIFGVLVGSPGRKLRCHLWGGDKSEVTGTQSDGSQSSLGVVPTVAT